MLRRGNDGEWKELQRTISVICSESGLTIRDSATNVLYADIPFASIDFVRHIGKNALLIACEGGPLGIQIPSAQETTEITRTLERHGVQLDGLPNCFPSLQDAKVQEFVLGLLFNEDFKSLVDQLEQLLSGMQEQLR